MCIFIIYFTQYNCNVLLSAFDGFNAQEPGGPAGYGQTAGRLCAHVYFVIVQVSNIFRSVTRTVFIVSVSP